MIAFILYVCAISVLLVAAATACEPLLRAVRLPTRSVWLAALFGAAIIAVMALWAPSRTDPATAGTSNGDRQLIEIGSTPVTSPSRSIAASLEPQTIHAIAPTSGETQSTPAVALIVAGGWLVASLVCFACMLAGARRVALLRRSCRAGKLCGEDVLVSTDVGPAVLGVLRHHIVIPAWVEELDSDTQRLIVAHEREHVRARDPLVLHAVLLLAALMPWNIALWFALHRLRAAIEIDCDARVLRDQRSVTRDYCRLLLDIGERTAAATAPLLALAEPVTLLERRIESMTTTRKLREWKTLVPTTVAVLLLAGACRTPRPAIAPIQQFGRMAHAFSSLPTSDVATVPVVAVPVQITAAPHVVAPAKQLVITDALASTNSSRTTTDLPFSEAFPVDAPGEDTVVRNEAALRRSAAEHQAHIDALADSVILASYPELTRRPPGTPAFLALVLDDRERVMRHAVSLDPALPNDLAAIMFALHVDTISARTIGMGISDDNRWHVTVGHAVELLGPARGRSEMRVSMTAPRPYALWRVPYQRIVDSVSRARNPEAYREHEGIFLIGMMLDETGNVMRYGADTRADSSIRSVRTNELLNRLAGDSARTGDISGVVQRLIPSKTTIVWGVRR